MDKSELLNGLHQEHRKWQTLLDEIGIARMDQPGVNGDWSMKDLVAHLAGWNRWLVTRLQAAQRREPEPPPPWPAHLQTEDEINAWVINASPLVNSFTISVMTMSRTYACGWRMWETKKE